MVETEQQPQPFHDALQSLETALETPLVPGELEPWLVNVHNALLEAGRQIKHQFQVVHPEQFADLRRQDPELSARVEGLVQEDEQILQRLSSLSDAAGRLVLAAPDCEPNELSLEGAVEKLVDDGLQFVIRVRKQETAATTWYLEAYQRDRGIAD